MKICSIQSLANTTKVLRSSAAHSKEVVERASRIYNYCKTKTKAKKISAGITGYIAPILKKIKTDSPTISAITEGYSAVKKNISGAQKAAENQGKSKLKTTMQGLRDSTGSIKEAMGALIGANDVKLAKEYAGTGKAILEGGKSAIRLIASSALSAACLPVPIPGAFVGGWFAGEKLAEKIVGKPFSKQIAKLK